jgi:hypothetical protein
MRDRGKRRSFAKKYYAKLVLQNRTDDFLFGRASVSTSGHSSQTQSVGKSHDVNGSLVHTYTSKGTTRARSVSRTCMHTQQHHQQAAKCLHARRRTQ